MCACAPYNGFFRSERCAQRRNKFGCIAERFFDIKNTVFYISADKSALILEETADGGRENFLLKAQIAVIKAHMGLALEHILAQKAVFIGAQTPDPVKLRGSADAFIAAIACRGKLLQL